MSDEEKKFDEELDRVFSEIKRLRQSVDGLKAELAASRAELAAHEKRELLRVRGQQFCRVCLQTKGKADPPN